MKIIAASVTQAVSDFLHMGYVSAGYAADPGDLQTVGGLLTSDGGVSLPDISAMVIAFAVVLWALSPLILSARTLWNPPDDDPPRSARDRSKHIKK